MQDTPLLTKIFSWSLVFESLLFLIFLVPGSEQATFHLGRLIQLIISLIIPAAFLAKQTPLGVYRTENRLIKKYCIYLLYTGIISCFGILADNYKIVSHSSYIYIRPFLEYLIFIYYFIYFSIFPLFLFKQLRDLNYFLNIFVKIFWLVIFIGLFDLLFVTLGFEGLYRHFYDERSIGFRFHSILGEPRDAFAYLLLALAIIHLKYNLVGKPQSPLYIIILIIACILLTQSFSGILGVFFAIGLFSINVLMKRGIAEKIFSIIIALAFIALVYEISSWSSRIQLYQIYFFDVFESLENGLAVNSVYKVALNNVYPIWDLWLNLKDFNFLPLIFGNGIGSSSYLNMRIMGEIAVINPNASLIRSLYEVGLVGTILLLSVFLDLIKHIRFGNRRHLMILIYMLIGSFFFHRTANIFIFIGIFLVFNRFIEANKINGQEKL